MPVDHATGEALPYPEDEKPNEDIQEMLDAADAIIGGEEAPVEEAPVEDEAPPEENAEGVDLAPIEEALDIDSTAAAELWEAAQERDDLAAMTPEELGAALAEDFGLRMQLGRDDAHGRSPSDGGDARGWTGRHDAPRDVSHAFR